MFYRSYRFPCSRCAAARAAVLIGAAWSLAGCARNGPPVEQPPPAVTVANPLLQEVTDYYEFPGRTAAVGEVEVRARVTGYIVKVHFEDGEEVEKGDLLFEIDPRPYEAALDRAKGELMRLQATLAKAQADLARSERLRPSGAVSQDEYEQHAAQVAIARASIQSAEAEIREAELNLEFTRITAPIDGRASRRLVTEGNLVQTGSGSSTILTTVVTTNPVYVYFDMEEPVLLKYLSLDWGADGKAVLHRIRELKVPVEIGLDNEEGFPHAGLLDFLDNKVNRGTGTIQARAVFDNSARHLTPGLYVRVRVPFGRPRQALLVSDRAIGTDLQQKFLLTVNEKNEVEHRDIQVGALHGGLRVVDSGIGPADRVIVKGLQRARPGEVVVPRNGEQAVASARNGLLDVAEAASPLPAAANGAN
ncbi:MAG: efflux RND transporter periplasmic adaptor subunit [Pirellulaceae bacterium]|nr:efflux RND transporter periplasmic adaptor subunit [Thermoguttaceae bacterium]MDI9446804.1 efflux RND transporter periplasmic adaptor subunit [Planctomycetota bacterium]NLZ03348.1 efflux RND transporter periplasmic adaptor subunit [Pirellulaceae bacterium]